MSAGYIVSDPLEATAGGAQVLIDSYDIGQCLGKIGMSREVENLIVKVGIPKTTWLQLPLGEDFNLEIPMLQVGNIANLARVTGIPSRTNDDTPVVTIFHATTPALSLGVHTFAPLFGFDQNMIRIGPNLSDLIVKNAAENVTYTVNDDYFVLDAAQGLVARNPGSAFTATATIHASYETIPVEYGELLFGKTVAIQTHKVEFLHISPSGGWLFHYCFWKCQTDGTIDLSMDGEGSAPMIALAKLKAQNDEANHPTSATQGPVGFLRIIPAALVAAYLATITVL